MKQFNTIITGNVVDIPGKRTFPGKVHIGSGVIQKIEFTKESVDDGYILPGLVDGHIHIESSMLSPQQFTKTAIQHGTVGTVSDPHEIANVLGEEGIQFMINNAKPAPLKINFGVPSCVPATPFETSGSVIDSEKVKQLIQEDHFRYLSEMMNFPGVLAKDEEVMKKIKSAQAVGKPIDGHAPGLRGEDLKKYIDAGITTEHECNTYDEAKEKLENGMMIQIREGSAAKNFDALWPLIREHPDQVMLCSDDRHPDDLIKGHINLLIRQGQEYGLDVFDLLKAATYNPVLHYDLPIGLLRQGDSADFIRVDDLTRFNVLNAYINGECYLDQGKVFFEPVADQSPNIMEAEPITTDDVQIADSGLPVRIIFAQDHQLYTSWFPDYPKKANSKLYSDITRDILKIAVMSRYRLSKPSVGFIHNFGLKKGAVGSSIAHDSHNLLVVGTDDHSVVQTMNRLIEQKGGIVVFDGTELHGLPLEIAGLMSHQSAEEVSGQLQHLTQITASLGCKLDAPFMTLSFMALPVIPELKMTDQGLFDVQQFQYVPLHVDQ
ncbi:MAG: adenine deaminase [Bacteroidota bacterium]